MRIAVAGGTGLVGRYVVDRARASGHDVVVLSRSNGVDLATGDGLEGVLAAVESVVDATNAPTTEERAATEFFVAVAENLQRAAEAEGVRQIVTLSIVGIDRVPRGYYAAKLAHERATLSGSVPATIVRATQFHEFPAQMIRRYRSGQVARIPNPRVRTVAARAVAAALIEVAEGAPAPLVEIAGPEEWELVALARAFVEARALDLQVEVDDGSSVRDGALLPGRAARIEGPTFAEWLQSEDARSLEV